jgi:hypothetical protein
MAGVAGPYLKNRSGVKSERFFYVFTGLDYFSWLVIECRVPATNCPIRALFPFDG